MLAFGTVAVLADADYRVVTVIGVMVCAALHWSGPWPTITFGGSDRDERRPRPRR